MAPKRNSQRLLLVAAGFCLIVLSLALQTTSDFTPLLVRHPWLLSAIASAGTIILLPFALLVAGFGLLRQVPAYQWSGFVALLVVAISSYWHPGYQVPLTGLTL